MSRQIRLPLTLALVAWLVVVFVVYSQGGNATPTSRVVWDQVAPDVATAQGYTYTHYDDANPTGIVLTGVTCADKVPVVSGTFDCSAVFPTFTAGAHTLTLTASNTVGESLKSTALPFTFITIPSPPRNLRPIG